MTLFNQNSIDAFAKKIVSTLDQLDDDKKGSGKGIISADTWNNIFQAKEKGGKEVINKISVFNAEKSIKYYLKQNAAKNKENINDIGQKWIEAVTNKDEIVPKENVPNNNNEQSETKIIQVETSSLLSTTEEQPVSTFVKKQEIIEPIQYKNEAEACNNFNELAIVTKNSSIKSDDNEINKDILDNAFDNVIKKLMKVGKKTRSVLIGAAKDFAASAEKYGVDIFTLMGISMIESAYGTSKMALTQNNVGGLTPKGKNGITCQSVADSIDIAAKTLHNNVYNKGLESINSVGMRGNYCCGTRTGRASWVKAVTSFSNSVRSEYNRLLSEGKEKLRHDNVVINRI